MGAWVSTPRGDGEVVAIYDTSLWTTPSDTNPVAVVVDDRIVVVDEADVEGRMRPEGAPAFDDVVQARGWHAGGVPFADDVEVLAITTHNGHHLTEDGYGDFAIDYVQTEDDGRTFAGDGIDNADYAIWGLDVVAPRGGVVFDVVDAFADQPPGVLGPFATGNWVGLALGDDLYVYVFHLQAGSIPVGLDVGDVVEEGALLGRVGNSGYSLEPHLHIVAYAWQEHLQRSFSVPLPLRRALTSSSKGGPYTLQEWLHVDAGTWLQPAP